MRPSASDTALLSILAAMPFRDRLELVALSGRPRATLYQRVERMERAGLLESVRHANELIASTRRYCLSAQGVGQLAIAEGIPVSQLLCCTPKSEQWRRILLERLDAVAAIYRFCEATPRVAHPLGFRWYRASPIDVALTLPDGRSVALVRQGVTADRTAFAKRIRRLHDAPGATAVLLIAPDEVRLRHARRLMTGTPELTFLAIEHDVVQLDAKADIWRSPAGPDRLTLAEALSYLSPTVSVLREQPPARTSRVTRRMGRPPAAGRSTPQ